MKCLKVTFNALYDTQGAFGHESISPGGAVFPKHLIISYDLETRTVVFPSEWNVELVAGAEKVTDFYRFKFIDPGWEAVLAKRFVSKIDAVEVDYDPKEFQQDKNLWLVTMHVLPEYKSRVDELVWKHSQTNMVVASRSREGCKVRTVSGKRETYPTHYYELVFQLVGNHFEFFKELQEQIPDKESYTVLADDPGVSPRQLANFKK